MVGEGGSVTVWFGGAGEVMVSAFTDVGWSPCYPIAIAIVSEVGSAISHGAVVAREFGIPCVTNCSGVTAKLRNGMRVRVDGASGSVTVLEE